MKERKSNLLAQKMGLSALALALVAASIALGTEPAAKTAGAKADGAQADGAQADGAQADGAQADGAQALTHFEMKPCAKAKVPRKKRVEADPRARAAAQKGLDYLARVGPQWQKGHNCYGCHVQAVTVEAFSVGHSNQYRINSESFDTMLNGMLELKGGARHPGGLSHDSAEVAKGSKLLGAIAFGRYDEHVGTKLRKELLFEAEKILELQSADGSVNTSWVNPPVSTGKLQYTALAMVTWRRAFERDADDRWLTAIGRAEDWLYGALSALGDKSMVSVQQLDYAAIGLVAAGVGAQETTLVDVRKAIAAQQNQDGGWGLNPRSASQPLATGQVMYTLRMLGLTDSDAAVRTGTEWLIKHQRDDGGWGSAGSDKAEAMWAVLGLVSVDVLSVSVLGLEDGVRVGARVDVTVEAADNKGGGVQKIEIMLDDIPVHGACGDTLSWTFDPSGLAEGKHIIDTVATNSSGEKSLRRFEVFVGDVFFTQVGSRFFNGMTEISARSLGGLDGGSFEVAIFELGEKGGVPTPGKKIRTLTLDHKLGSARLRWDGKVEGGALAKAGKYRARILARDSAGDLRQSRDLDFVHDTVANQKAKWAQVQGRLAFDDGGSAANAEVELVDEEGNVVARTRSTGAGQYRFKGVSADKNYKVRVKKKGFQAESKEFAPSRAEDEAVDLDVKEEQ